jgi:putative SOS response-associated peptidase YedK
MCGRYTLTSRGREVAETFELDEEPELDARHNIAPGQPIAVVARRGGRRECSQRHWGFHQGGDKGRFVINARCETVASRPSFRDAFETQRCLVPANGFFEWRRQGTGRAPYYLHLRDDGLFAMAGIWHRWPRPDGTADPAAVILTTRPNDLVSSIHDRMPMILEPSQWATWLGDDKITAEQLGRLAQPLPAERMRRTPVSTRVNRVANDDPELLLPVDEPPTQLGLF